MLVYDKETNRCVLPPTEDCDVPPTPVYSTTNPNLLQQSHDDEDRPLITQQQMHIHGRTHPVQHQTIEQYYKSPSTSLPSRFQFSQQSDETPGPAPAPRPQHSRFPTMTRPQVPVQRPKQQLSPRFQSEQPTAAGVANDELNNDEEEPEDHLNSTLFHSPQDQHNQQTLTRYPNFEIPEEVHPQEHQPHPIYSSPPFRPGGGSSKPLFHYQPNFNSPQKQE